MSFIAHLEKRIAERRMALEEIQTPEEHAPTPDKPLIEIDMAAMVAEFVCVIVAALVLLIGQAAASCALMLGAIYLKLRR
jgi:hypothetical protein